MKKIAHLHLNNCFCDSNEVSLYFIPVSCLLEKLYTPSAVFDIGVAIPYPCKIYSRQLLHMSEVLKYRRNTLLAIFGNIFCFDFKKNQVSGKNIEADLHKCKNNFAAFMVFCVLQTED